MTPGDYWDAITRTPRPVFLRRDLVRRHSEADSRVGGIALGRNASGLKNQRLKSLAASVLSRRGSGSREMFSSINVPP